MQRQFDCFDEFTLGRIRAWADDCGGQMFFNVALDTVRVVIEGRNIMYWVWGNPAYFAWRGGYITVSTLQEEICAYDLTAHDEAAKQRFLSMLEMIGNHVLGDAHE